MKRIIIFIGIYFFCASKLVAQNESQRIYVVDFYELNTQKTHIKNGDKKALENYKVLIKEADKLLNRSMFSVVHKMGIPPSQSKQDYMSIGPYYWPNPNTENGLPYIRKDGKVNPESRNNFTDIVEKAHFISAVKTLSEAYFFSDVAKYGLKNIEFINAWFVNDATKMNPNLNYGQSVPGESEGRCFAIIEFSDIMEIIKFLEIAKQKGILDNETEKAMFDWFTAYSYWLQNSELGKEEATRKNNHGTHYDAQLLSILIYLNKIEEVEQVETPENSMFYEVELEKGEVTYSVQFSADGKVLKKEEKKEEEEDKD